MPALDRAALLAPSNQKRVRKPLGPLGAEVVFRKLSVGQMLACSKRFAGLAEGDAEGAYRAALGQVVMSLCNDDDSPMFAADELDATVDGLMGQDSDVVEALITACAEVQGKAKDNVKASLGNSDEIPSESSSSGSAGISDTQAPNLSLSA